MPPMDREYPGGLPGPVDIAAIASRPDPWFLAMITNREDFGDLSVGINEQVVNLYSWERIDKVTRPDSGYPKVILEPTNDVKGPWLDAKHNRRVGFAINIHEVGTLNTGARNIEAEDYSFFIQSASGGDPPHSHIVQVDFHRHPETVAGSAMEMPGSGSGYFREFLTWMRFTTVPWEIRKGLGAEPVYLFHYVTDSVRHLVQGWHFPPHSPHA